MNRTIELIRLLVVCGHIDGRKKLQKIVHILKEAGHPFAYHYGFHFHGPFSAELKGEIDALASEGLIVEEKREASPGEFVKYSFSASPKAAEVLKKAPTSEAHWSELAGSLNEKSAQELESISTVVYLIRRGYTADALKMQFASLKPHLVSSFETSAAFAKEAVKSPSLQPQAATRSR